MAEPHSHRLTPDHPLPFNCAVQRKLLDVSQRKKHPDQKQRVCAVQQPQRAAHRPAASHLLHGGPCQCGQHGQRVLGRPQLLPPSAAVQRAKCRYEHIAHHAGQAIVWQCVFNIQSELSLLKAGETGYQCGPLGTTRGSQSRSKTDLCHFLF